MRIGAFERAAVFDIEADRRAVFRIHAGVHRENERFALIRQSVREPRERAIDFSFLVAQKKPNVALARIEVAHCVGGAALLDIGAGVRICYAGQREERHRRREHPQEA